MFQLDDAPDFQFKIRIQLYGFFLKLAGVRSKSTTSWILGGLSEFYPRAFSTSNDVCGGTSGVKINDKVSTLYITGMHNGGHFLGGKRRDVKKTETEMSANINFERSQASMAYMNETDAILFYCDRSPALFPRGVFASVLLPVHAHRSDIIKN